MHKLKIETKSNLSTTKTAKSLQYNYERELDHIHLYDAVINIIS